MLLNMTLIADAIKTSNFNILSHKSSPLCERRLKYTAYYTGISDFKNDILYIASSESLSLEPHFAKDTAIICLGYPPYVYQNNSDELICLSADTDIFKLFNYIQELFESFNNWENQLQDASFSQDAFSAIGKIAFERLQTPLSAYDNCEKILFYEYDSSRPEFLDIYTSIATEYSYIPEDERRLIYNDKEFMSTYLTDGASFVDSDIYGSNSIYINLRHSGQYIGRVVLEDSYREFNESDYTLVEFIGGIVKDVLLRSHEFHFGFSEAFEQMMQNLLFTHMPYLLEYDKNLSQIHWNRYDKYRCVCVCINIPSADKRQTFMTDSLLYLNELFDHHYVCLTDSAIIQIINLTKCSYTSDEHIRRIELFLKNNNYIAGISTEFNDLANVWYYLQQGVLASQNLFKNKRIIKFDDCVLEILLNNLTGNYGGEFYCTDAIIMLKQYDEENSSELLTTLKCYLRNNLNASKIQEELHIARTTAIYRIKRIKSITHLNLENKDVQLYLLILFRLLERG